MRLLRLICLGVTFGLVSVAMQMCLEADAGGKKADPKDKAAKKDKADSPKKDKADSPKKDKADSPKKDKADHKDTVKADHKDKAVKTDSASHKAPTPAAPAKGPTTDSSVDKASLTRIARGLAVLKAVTKVLQVADHDYGGHRVAAVRDVGAAENQLQSILGIQGPGLDGARH
jgi:hypothetical protein